MKFTKFETLPSCLDIDWYFHTFSTKNCNSKAWWISAQGVKVFDFSTYFNINCHVCGLFSLSCSCKVVRYLVTYCLLSWLLFKKLCLQTQSCCLKFILSLFTLLFVVPSTFNRNLASLLECPLYFMILYSLISTLFPYVFFVLLLKI